MEHRGVEPRLAALGQVRNSRLPSLPFGRLLCSPGFRIALACGEQPTGLPLCSAPRQCECRALTLVTDTWETAVLFTAEPDSEYYYLDGTLCVSQDDSLLAVTKAEQITLCSLRDGTVAGTMTMTDEVDHTAVSPDGNVLIAACKENIFCLALQWELSFPGWKDQDEQAEPVIRQFLENHPHPDEKQRQALLQELCNRGFGYIRPESVLAAVQTDPKFTELHKPDETLNDASDIRTSDY